MCCRNIVNTAPVSVLSISVPTSVTRFVILIVIVPGYQELSVWAEMLVS